MPRKARAIVATSVEYLRKLKKEHGLSYQELAELTDTTDGFWYLVIKRGELIGLDRAAQLCDALGIEAITLMNLVFRDRCIRHLEKEGLLENHPTPQVKKIIGFLKRWDPVRGNLGRYIMSTPSLSGSLAGTQIAVSPKGKPNPRCQPLSECLKHKSSPILDGGPR